MNSRAMIGAVMTATEPVKHMQIVLPLSIDDVLPVMSLDG